MLKKIAEYTYYVTEKCSMCQEPIQNHKLLGRRLNGPHGWQPNKKIGITTSVLQCNVCNLIHAYPLPAPTDIQDHYNVAPEEYWDASYFDIPKDYFQHSIREIKRLLNVSSESITVLEVGAATGKSLKVMLEVGWDAYGVEPSKEFRKQAIEKMSIPAEKIVLGMIEDIDFEEEKFDCVNIQNVLEHLYDPGEVIEKLVRWTKPNGIILIGIPCSEWLTGKAINFMNRIRGKEYVTNLSPMHPPYHLYEFSARSFEKNGEYLGYTLEETQYWSPQTPLLSFLDKSYTNYLKKNGKGMILSGVLRKNK